ncbi:serine protease SP24D-like [Haematobia irritans]|uniref:serine protease SP24D-like n=1 Tax=Haematobia irritans TaxID=7368 RepID=UPI003F4F684D
MDKLSLVLVACIVAVACSTALPNGRVLGGQDAYEGQFPYMTSLRRNGSHRCGATIISQIYELTAAHCVGAKDSLGNYYIFAPTELSVRVGSNERFRGGIIVNVSEIIVHEDYGNFLNDIALVRLTVPLVYTNNIQPIPLASAVVPTGSDVVIMGFGRINQNGDLPQKLQWNILKAICGRECERKINNYSEGLICLGHEADNGACNGDSGGPAVYEGEVRGVANFVYGGCGSTNPDGYANVFFYRCWIILNSDLANSTCPPTA